MVIASTYNLYIILFLCDYIKRIDHIIALIILHVQITKITIRPCVKVGGYGFKSLPNQTDFLSISLLIIIGGTEAILHFKFCCKIKTAANSNTIIIFLN